jgi:hypothetical protein
MGFAMVYDVDHNAIILGQYTIGWHDMVYMCRK